jgi:UDP-N-acetylglucosamine transferase subunit ALG13
MDPRGFERLVKEMDEIAAKIKEDVIMQIAGTKYSPKNAKHFSFATEQEIKELCRQARVVVTHGGVGTILDVLQVGTPVVVVPRLRKHGEVIDDHQLFFVQELEKQRKVIAVYDVERLEEVLLKLDTSKIEIVRDRRLVNALKGYIDQFARSLSG